MRSKIAYKEICEYSRLEKAVKHLHLEEMDETEEGLLNLHNHLVWHSYRPGKDPVADAIVLFVIDGIMKEHEIGTEDLPEIAELWLAYLQKGERD